MKNNRRIKLIAASVALMTSFSAMAGLGGLNVQSNLGEPFSGTVTVSGEEAKILLSGGKATLSDGNLRSSVRKSGENAVVSIRSSRPIQDPVLIFQLGVGSQARQYTAIIDPPGYAAKRGQPDQAARQAAARERVAEAVAAEGTAGASARAPAARVSERRAAPARQQVRTPARPAAQRGGEYTVRRGETLSASASRVRPGGLSTHQTVQALILANPELFSEQSADKIWPGNVLNIPSAAELHRLAQQGAAEPAAVTDAETPAVAASEAAAVAPASEPAVIAVPAPASDVAAAPASEPAAEAVSAEASEPAVAPVPQPAPAEEAAPAAESEDESSGLWRWLLLGGLGLIALWILSKLLGKKQKHIVIRDEETDEIDAVQPPFDDKTSEAAAKPDTAIRTEQPVVRPSKSAPLTRAEAAATMGAAAAATAAAKKTAPVEEGGLEVEDDFDDDIFFTEVSEAPPTKSDENINLDLGDLDRQQGGILSGAVTRDVETEQRKDVDWDAIESTDSVYEPETEAGFTPVNVEMPTEAPVDAEAEPADERDFTPLEFEAPVAEAAPEHKPLVVETVVESAEAPESVAEETWFKEISQDGGIEVQENEDFAAEAAPTAAETETIEWDDLGVGEESSRDGAGFISESVGMTAPLEAKYELAKMYVEIGDPEAAKETLLELLEESDGAILAKAKTMLAELEK